MKKFIVVIAILTFAPGLFASYVIIGSGMNPQRYPMGSYYGYERSAALYTASEIGAQSGPIRAIGWLANSTTTAIVPTKIYLKTTTASTLANSSWATMISGATLLYDQNQSGLATLGWTMLTLNSTFPVANGKNLIVLVERNYGGAGSNELGGGPTGSEIYASSATGKHLTWNRDTTPPTGSGTTETNRPNVMLEIGSAIVNFPFVEGFETGNVDQFGAIKDWTQELVPYTFNYWTANNSQTNYNRAPRTGVWNATLKQSGQTCLIRPIQLTAGMNYSIEFYARHDFEWDQMTIQAKYGFQASIAGMTKTILYAVVDSFDDYQRFFGVFSPPATGLYYIGIQGDNDDNVGSLSLDDITIDVLSVAPHVMPFVEEWGSADFEADFEENLWAIDSGNWEIDAVGLPVGPSARFRGNSSGENYSSSLSSYEIDATGIDAVQLSFNSHFSDQPASTNESKMTCQIWNGTSWNTLGSCSSLDKDSRSWWTENLYDISAYASNRVFKIRYVVSGEDVNWPAWYIDSIKVAPPTFNPLPFTEDWSSNGYETNNWTTDTPHWKVGSADGIPAPAAYFVSSPRIYNYNSALTSHNFDARGVGSMQLSFDLKYTRQNASVGTMQWEIWNGGSWITLGSCNSGTNSVDWTPYTCDVSAQASNRIFKIRFVASGADSNDIWNWGLDNIRLTGTSAGGAGISSRIAFVGTNVVLNWTAMPDTTWYWIYTTTNLNESFVPLGSVTLPSATNSLSSLPGNTRFFKVTTGTGPTPE